MDCVIPGANVKVLARAIHALAKIGEEIYVQPQERCLSFRSVGMSNSAYCDFTFRDNYFSYYNYGNISEEDALKCKISMRGALAVFKTPAVMDKLVETSHIKLEPEATELILTMKYKNGVVKTFLLPILDCETIQASYNKEGTPNHLLVQPKVLANALHNFQPNVVEVTLEVSEEKILMRNYVNDTAGLGNATRTQLALALGEFDTYSIGLGTSVTFCVKEVRAILAFADMVTLPIHLLFEIAGRPIVFVVRNPSFEVNLVLSTVNPEIPDVSSIAVPNRRPKRRIVGAKAAAPPAKSRKKNSKLPATGRNITGMAPTRNLESRTALLRPRETSRQIEEDDNAESLAELVRSSSINNQPPINNSGTSEASSSSFDINSRRTSQRTNIISETPSSALSTPPRLRIFSGTSSECTAGRQSSIANENREENAKNLVNYSNTNDENADDEEDCIPNSPPRISSSKKAKAVFKKCFQATFDPRMLPGHDEILAEDSDECD